MIIYYTDGSAVPNPGPGGFAVIKEKGLRGINLFQSVVRDPPKDNLVANPNEILINKMPIQDMSP